MKWRGITFKFNFTVEHMYSAFLDYMHVKYMACIKSYRDLKFHIHTQINIHISFQTEVV